jgi:hypothetical protein
MLKKLLFEQVRFDELLNVGRRVLHLTAFHDVPDYLVGQRGLLPNLSAFLPTALEGGL